MYPPPIRRGISLSTRDKGNAFKANNLYKVYADADADVVLREAIAAGKMYCARSHVSAMQKGLKK